MFASGCVSKESAVGAYIKVSHDTKDGSCVRIPTSLPLGVWGHTFVCLVYCSLCERAAFGRPSLGLGQKERGPKSPLKQRSSTATIPV